MMDIITTVLSFIFAIITSVSGVNEEIYTSIENITFEENYAFQVASIIYREFNCWYFTMVYMTNETSFENYILRNIETFDDGFPVMLLKKQGKSYKNQVDHHGRTVYIVIQPRLSLKSVDSFITSLKNARTWKPRSNVIFVLQHPVNTTTYFMYDVRRHFELLWSRRIVNSILVIWSTRLQIYTYNPFTEEVMDISGLAGVKKILQNKFKDLHGYPFRVTLFKNVITDSTVGCQKVIVSTLVRYLKASCVVQQPRDHGTVGLLYANGSATGATADLIFGFTDMELNSRILKLQYYGHIDTTYPVTQDDLIFLVAKGRKHDSFTAVLIFLPPAILFFLIFVMTSVIVLALMIRKFEKSWFGIPHRHCTGSVAMDLMKCFLRQSVVILFSGAAFRTIVFAIQIYSLVLNCAIDGVLTTAITFPTYYPDMDTLAELTTSNHDIIIHKRHIDIVEKNLSPEIVARVQVVSEMKMKELLDAKIYGNVYLMRKSEATYVSRKQSNIVHDRPFYHRMSESAIPCLIVYGMRHGSPYLPRVERAISLLSESGILSYWGRVKSYSLYKEGKKVLFNGSSRFKSPLDLKNTYGVFYVWLTGVVLSVIVFCLEIFYSTIVHKLK